jgi:hypothetical protein
MLFISDTVRHAWQRAGMKNHGWTRMKVHMGEMVYVPGGLG